MIVRLQEPCSPENHLFDHGTIKNRVGIGGPLQIGMPVVSQGLSFKRSNSRFRTVFKGEQVVGHRGNFNGAVTAEEKGNVILRRPGRLREP